MYTVDLEGLQKGEWRDYKDGLRVRIRRLPSSEQMEMFTKLKETGSDEEKAAITFELASRILTDWSGMFDAQDTVMEYSKEVAATVLDYHPDLAIFIVDEMRKLEEEREKNLNASQDTLQDQ